MQRSDVPEQRIIGDVERLAVLTAAAAAEPARERLRAILGYRLYRSLVAGLAG